MIEPGTFDDVLKRRLAANFDAWRRRVEWLGRTGLGQDALARWTGYSSTTVVRLLKGEGQKISWSVLDRLAEMMDLDDPATLFSDGYDWDRHFAVRRFGRGRTDESDRVPPPKPARNPEDPPPWRWRPDDDDEED